MNCRRTHVMGALCAQGYNAALDELRALRESSRKVIAGLQATYAGATGVKTLKVRHNNVLGYFVEVTALHAPTLMGPASFGDLYTPSDHGKRHTLLDDRTRGA